jgi:hypothetical protein
MIIHHNPLTPYKGRRYATDAFETTEADATDAASRSLGLVFKHDGVYYVPHGYLTTITDVVGIGVGGSILRTADRSEWVIADEDDPAEERHYYEGRRYVQVAPAAAPAGRKDDAGKPRPSLVPWRAMAPVIRVLTHVAARYGDDNWRAVDRKRYVDALLRHVLAYAADEGPDEDTGESHLAHAVCCALFLLGGDS